MGKFIRNFWVGAGLVLALGVAGNAQVYREGPYRDRQYYRGDRDGYREGGVVEHVRYDLDRALSVGYLSRGQYKTLEHARQDLNDFEREAARGGFSKHELDEAIGRIQSVVNNGRMPNETRAMLQSDADRLRDFRATRGGYRY